MSEAEDSNERVLVVDDEPGVRRFLARSLESHGYPVQVAGTAEEGLERASSEEPGVVLADLRLPEHDGRWLLERVGRDVPDAAVVMVTGNLDVQTAVECLTLGAVDYVIKPVNTEELVQVVKKAFDDRRVRLENRMYREELERLVEERTAELEQTVEELDYAHSAVQSAYRESIYRLAAAAELRDEETGNHIVRMGFYCQRIAQELSDDPEFLTLMLLASPMHDVGKIGIRDSILLKPGKLTPEEFEEIKAHTSIGARILSGSTSPLIQLAEQIALTHHEKFNGAGYPQGLAGRDIPLSGRIVALADVFDALVSERVYKPAFDVDTSLTIIHEEMDGSFDPEVVRAFFGCLDDLLAIRTSYTDAAVAQDAEAALSDGAQAIQILLSEGLSTPPA